ncbi:MAG: diguanylate cyclase [bacterium]|nr:diguanylate cyclase [bacterium]
MSQRLLLRAALKGIGCDVVAVGDVVSAERRLRSDGFGAILVAREFPDADALGWIAGWQRNAGRGKRSVYVLNSRRAARWVLRARKAGAVDVVARPGDAKQARALVSRLGQAGGFEVLPDGAARGFRGSGIPNNDRMRLLERIGIELDDAATLGMPLALGLVAFENLPDLKIEHGRELGEEILAQLEGVVLDGVRAGDFVARNTGCEIALLMPYTDRRDAMRVMARLCTAIEERTFGPPELQCSLDLATGVSVTGSTRSDGKSLLKRCLADMGVGTPEGMR